MDKLNYIQTQPANFVQSKDGKNKIELDQNPQETHMSLAFRENRPILAGLLLKKNKWSVKQERRFELYADGKIKYYKASEWAGTFELTKVSKARKVSRFDLEVAFGPG